MNIIKILPISTFQQNWDFSILKMKQEVGVRQGKIHSNRRKLKNQQKRARPNRINRRNVIHKSSKKRPKEKVNLKIMWSKVRWWQIKMRLMWINRIKMKVIMNQRAQSLKKRWDLWKRNLNLQNTLRIWINSKRDARKNFRTLNVLFRNLEKFLKLISPILKTKR